MAISMPRNSYDDIYYGESVLTEALRTWWMLHRMEGHMLRSRIPPDVMEQIEQSDVTLSDIGETVKITALNILNHGAGVWIAFCKLRGIDIYSMSDGRMTGSEEFELTHDEVKQLGIVQ